MQNKFKVGDIVVRLKEYNRLVYAGAIGLVVENDKTPYVCWENEHSYKSLFQHSEYNEWAQSEDLMIKIGEL